MTGIRSKISIALPNSETGMVLLLCLIFLTALMLLGLSASADTILQNQLAANLQESERIKQSAQTTLLKAEQWLLPLDDPEPQLCEKPCSSPVIHPLESLPQHPEFKPHSWWIEQGNQIGTNQVTGKPEVLAANASTNTPIWLIEPIHSVAAAQDGSTKLRVWYRVLTRASNRTGTLVSVVESLIVRSWVSTDQTPPPDIDNSEICSVPTELCGRVAWRKLR